MKFALALIFVVLVFVPSVAFGWKAPTNLENTCYVSCGQPYLAIDQASPFNFILLGTVSTIGLGVYYKISHMEKNEIFRLDCITCGRRTNGLKCPYCAAEKQRI